MLQWLSDHCGTLFINHKQEKKEEKNIVFDLINRPTETDQLHHSHVFILVFHVLIFPSNTMRITFSFLVCGGLHKRGTIVFDLGVIGVVECTHKLWVHITMHHHHHVVEWQREKRKRKGFGRRGQEQGKGCGVCWSLCGSS